jgi:hypothetical protein
MQRRCRIGQEIPAMAPLSGSQRHGYCFHDPVRLGQDFQDALIMFDVIEAERPALAVFQPFLGGLVAADIKVP